MSCERNESGRQLIIKTLRRGRENYGRRKQIIKNILSCFLSSTKFLVTAFSDH